MTRWIVLLRGINVGGHHRLPMPDLVAAREGPGHARVRTLIASGNAVADGPDADPAPLAARITGAIEGRHGFAPHVMLLTRDALRAAVDGCPFPEAASAPKTLHALFLDREPGAPDLDGLAAAAAPGERFALRGAVLYLHLPLGLGESRLAGRAERLVGVPATARNWATVTRLLAMADERP